MNTNDIALQLEREASSPIPSVLTLRTLASELRYAGLGRKFNREQVIALSHEAAESILDLLQEHGIVTEPDYSKQQRAIARMARKIELVFWPAE